jgi:hypothetical protein
MTTNNSKVEAELSQHRAYQTYLKKIPNVDVM